MTESEIKKFLQLAQKEGWEVKESKEYRAKYGCQYYLTVEGRQYKLQHPYSICLKQYRTANSPTEKFKWMKKAHDYIWPQYIDTWNEWEERIFKVHCGDWEQIVLASGGGCGKSLVTAKVAVLWWLANPKKRACIISSTTLDSLERRIWGYATKLFKEAKIPLVGKITSGKSSKITHPGSSSKIYGMFAVAIREGTAKRTISTIIGSHPEDGVMFVIDESTDIEPSIVDALPNLKKGTVWFQLIALGNSSDRSDLHGALATPENEWDSVSWKRDELWKTKNSKGICLYFNPYKSPAITDPDPAKRERLGKFLMTLEKIEEDKKNYGEDSDAFYRFTLGFWRDRSIESTVMSDKFINEQEATKATELSGCYPLQIVAGLDPAYHAGTKGCVLRLGYLGHSMNEKMVLDYRREELLYRINITVTDDKSAERQIAEQVIQILQRHNCPVRCLTIDASGAGRALGELIKIISGGSEEPWRIISIRGSTGSVNAGLANKRRYQEIPFFKTFPPMEMWFKFREFMQHRQIFGLDMFTVEQLSSRLVLSKKGRQELEEKKDYKTRMSAINPRLAHSPDEADASILCLFSAILNFGFYPGQKKTMPITPENMFYFQKMNGLKRMQEEERNTRRAGLVPNFGSGLEDLGRVKLIRN